MPVCGGDGDPLRIETVDRPDATVAHISGEIDLANVGHFKDGIWPAVRNCRNVILEVSALRYIDSTGLHVLIDALKSCRQNGCRLVVVGASPGIAKIMRILNLDGQLPLLPSVEEAADLIRGKPSMAAPDD